jgi:plasmid maintenance system antidote protein VapI
MSTRLKPLPDDIAPRDAIVTQNIRDLYVTLELTQKTLAPQLGLTQESVSRYLRGASRWTIDMIFTWAAALGVSVEALIHPKAQEN